MGKTIKLKNDIKLDTQNIRASSVAGYRMDMYGNFHHLRDTANDEWELYDYSENIRLKYLWETGVLKLNDLDVKTTSYIYAMPSSDITIPNGSYTEATNLTSVYSKGNLSISNGKIKIGSHISYIKITITIGLNNYNDDLYSFLTKNGTSTGFWLVNNITGSYSATTRSEILPVSENDEISFNVYLGSGGTLVSNRTNVIVEAL